MGNTSDKLASKSEEVLAKPEFRNSLREVLSAHAGEMETLEVLAFDSLDSTMSFAQRVQQQGVEAVPAGAAVFDTPEATHFATKDLLIISRRQSAGRGRNQRAWHSMGDGGIYLSFVFQFQQLPAALSAFSLVAGLAVQKTVASFGLKPRLKWPNDLLLQVGEPASYLKLAGLLAESYSGRDAGHGVTLGIGLNVAQSEFPPEVPGISMQQALRAQDLSRGLTSAPDYFSVLAVLVRETLRHKQLFERDGFIPFREAWWECSMMQEASIRLPEDAEIYQATGVAEDGALELCSEKGVRRKLYSGEISLSGLMSEARP